MAKSLWLTARAFGWSIVFALLAGCGRDEQDAAIGELYEADFAFTVDDYLRAAKQGRADTVRWFLQAGMDVDANNQFGERALLLAAERGHTETVAVLLAAGAGYDIEGPGGRTPLMGAAEVGDARSVAELLKLGADPARRDIEDWTALRLAAYYGRGGAVGELVGVVPRESLDSALFLAALGGHVEVLDRLLVAGADIYRRTPEGQTALMLAAARGHLGAARVLLQRGANRFATDGDGRTAAIFAEQAGQAEAAQALGDAPGSDLPGAALPVLAEAEVERPGTVWRLDGAQLEGDPAASQPITLSRYREQQLPMALEAVEPAGGAALRMLFEQHRTVWVKVGEQVPRLPFLIVRVNRELGARKGDGSQVVLQSATVRDLRTGREFEMTPEDPGLSTYSHVDLVDARGRAFRGHRGDRFELRTTDGAVPFRVLELRPREVLVERLDTGEVVAVRGREGGRGA